MKRMILVAAMFVSVAAFANKDNVDPRVLDAFKNEFTDASDIAWKVSSNHYIATFSMNGQYVTAYYNENGSLSGITRNISPVQLPIILQASLKKNYSNYWVSDLFEVANNNGTHYYITLENGDKKVVLQSASSSDWLTYTKSEKE